MSACPLIGHVLDSVAGFFVGAGDACLAGLSRGLPHLEDLCRIVRRQLAAGRWALVVHGVT